MSWNRRLNLFCILAATVVWSTTVYSQDSQSIEKHVVSAFISQFTKLIEWPEKAGDFVIYVIEDDELVKVLDAAMADKDVKSRPVKVKSSNWSEAVLSPAEILILPKKESKFHRPVIEKLKTVSCLVVGFTDGLGAAGATINFFLSDGKMRFELNTKSVKEKRLVVSATITKLAKIID